MARTIEHADVTGSEWRSAELPELVHELGRLGYRVLGRVAQRSGGGSDSQFDREQRQRLHDWRARAAATMLVATDGHSYVTVDKYGDAPVLRFRTAFTDGTLVETVGLTREGILQPRPGLDPFEGFAVGDATGRSVELIKDVPVSEVVQAHRIRVGGRSARPRDHVDLADAVALWNDAAHHTLESSRALSRWRRLVGIGWLLVALVPAVGATAAMIRVRDVDSAALTVVVGLVVGATTLTLLVRPIRACGRALGRARWWRPPYVG